MVAGESLTPIGFIDDDPRMTGHMAEGVKVFGTSAETGAGREELWDRLLGIAADRPPREQTELESP